METGIAPLEGGYSGETFLAVAGDERTVVRIYTPGRRPPQAAEIDAAVLQLVRGLLPVPEVLEVRRGDPDAATPGVLVTELLPGTRMDLVLPTLDTARLDRLGSRIGTLLARLSHMAMPRAGQFVDAELHVQPFAATLVEWAGRLDLDVPGLQGLLEEADDLVASTRRSCLVHSDFNPKNVLLDAATLEVTALLDWEFAHAGNPYTDLGNLLRFEDTAGLAASVLHTYAALVPDAPQDLLQRARAADLFALVELASRAGENPVADRAAARLRELAAPFGP